MKIKTVFNFSAGPSMLPEDVLIHVQKELRNWNKLGMSIMEISHRSKNFIHMAHDTEKNLRDLLKIPSYYKVLFCHGGGRAQFSAVPLNLLKNNGIADYIYSGYWSYSAAQEGEKYCFPNIIDVRKNVNNITSIIPMHSWNIRENSSYIHFCPNETIDGICINEELIFQNKIIVADFSSAILSCPIDINKFGIIYASAQKNIGPAGITIVIVREDLIGQARKELPSILNYAILAKHDSMFNTPTTFSWYVAGLVLKWIKKNGGLKKFDHLNQCKANLLYHTIDNSDFYYNNIHVKNRSKMNIPFYLFNSNLTNMFIKKAMSCGLYGLKGHNAVGGIRASLYNAMPLKGVEALVNFMKDFEHRYG